LIADQPNSAQLEGTPYHSAKLHPDLCSSVGMRQGTDRHTDRQMCVTNTHFASSTTHAKYSNDNACSNVTRLRQCDRLSSDQIRQTRLWIRDQTYKLKCL